MRYAMATVGALEIPSLAYHKAMDQHPLFVHDALMDDLSNLVHFQLDFNSRLVRDVEVAAVKGRSVQAWILCRH